ncbi:hypothetical protein BU16DRAFT_164456 [Lophium mytilinum]|uniref:Uncharacterized protein n=1 Tax=Lophium mytilinum TaxID=390894 RepID=A0A6A6QBY2_9PEZI|nr:hypothetical protein BU16DRAFT_164456 [Lophium mytilinum]
MQVLALISNPPPTPLVVLHLFLMRQVQRSNSIVHTSKRNLTLHRLHESYIHLFNATGPQVHQLHKSIFLYRLNTLHHLH